MYKNSITESIIIIFIAAAVAAAAVIYMRSDFMFDVLLSKRIMFNRLIVNLNPTRHLHLGVTVFPILLYPEFFFPQVFHLRTRQQLRLELFAYVPLFLFVDTRVSKSFRYGKSQYIP